MNCGKLRNRTDRAGWYQPRRITSGFAACSRWSAGGFTLG